MLRVGREQVSAFGAVAVAEGTSEQVPFVVAIDELLGNMDAAARDARMSAASRGRRALVRALLSLP